MYNPGVFQLPKGAPVVTQLSAAATPGPQFLSSLARQAITGYVAYAFAASQAVLLYDGGRMISATLSRGGGRVSGLEALTELFRRIATEPGTVDVYRLTPDLVMCLHALLQGEVLHKDQDMRLVDAKGLLAKIKADRLNGCLRIYTQEKNALIFYRDGVGIGFFHDGSDRIETQINESQRIAGLPGAKLDVFSTRPPEELRSFDLLEMVNVEKLWDSTVRAHQAQLEKLHADAAASEQRNLEQKLKAVHEGLRALAIEQIGKLGGALVDKELLEDRAILLDAEKRTAFLGRIEAGAKLVAGMSKVKALVAQMREKIEAELSPLS